MAQWGSADFPPEGSGIQFPGLDKIGSLVSGQMATLVGRVAATVVPAFGTQPADQG